MCEFHHRIYIFIIKIEKYENTKQRRLRFCRSDLHVCLLTNQNVYFFYYQVKPIKTS